MISLRNLQICRGKLPKFSLTLSKGEHWGVLGPNGCGKSSLLLTLANQLPFEGDILLQQKHLKHWSSRKQAEQIAVLLQGEDAIFPYSVEEYTEFARINPNWPLAKQSWLKALELKGLSQRPISHLSGGEWQRVRIATALTQNTPILLMDEPLNHLDIRHQIQAMEILKSIQPERLIISSLHDINQAWAYCDHIILIGESSVITGPASEVLTSKNLTRAFQHPIQNIDLGHRQFFYPDRHD